MATATGPRRPSRAFLLQRSESTRFVPALFGDVINYNLAPSRACELAADDAGGGFRYVLSQQNILPLRLRMRLAFTDCSAAPDDFCSSVSEYRAGRLYLLGNEISRFGATA